MSSATAPVTPGHLDIIERARHLFARVTVLVAVNPAPSYLALRHNSNPFPHRADLLSAERAYTLRHHSGRDAWSEPSNCCAGGASPGIEEFPEFREGDTLKQDTGSPANPAPQPAQQAPCREDGAGSLAGRVDARGGAGRPPGRVRGDHDCPIAIATSKEFPAG